MFIHNPDAPVVLVGGSGVVGRRLAPLLARLEGRPLILTGRRPAAAETTLAAVRSVGGDARFVPLDLSSPAGRLSVSAVVGLVNDPRDALLLATMDAGVPFVDITRWTSRVTRAVGRLALARPRAPVIMSSGWMGGLLARVAALLSSTLGGELDRIDGAIRYALRDAAGPDSVDYVDRLWIPFDVTRDAELCAVLPFSDPRRIEVAGASTTAWRFDTPDQWSLPLTLGARNVAVRLGFDSTLAGVALAWLTRAGFFRWFAADRFTRLRHAILRDAGAAQRSGAPAAFRVDVRNVLGTTRALSVSTAHGHAELTAVGAWLGLRFALADPQFPGVRFPEDDPDNAALLDKLERAEISAQWCEA
jgi:hypothetical protein